jgi:cysteine desulfurase
MIYLDNNATTQLDPAVLEAMLPFLKDHFANPSSAYSAAKPVRKAVALAREQAAAFLDCDPDEIIFTSGGTEADNAAILSARRLYPEKSHFVTCSAEHDAVTNCLKSLQASDGIEITSLTTRPDGTIDLDELRHAIRPGRTAMVTLMMANNETGVIQPVTAASEIAESSGALFHTDAVQAAAKIPIRLRNSSIHSLALSGHKFHAPKGVGILYINRRTAFSPLLTGGSQENQRRAGTENPAAIAALGTACLLGLQHLESLTSHPDPIAALRDHFELQISSLIDGVTINGASAPRTPNTSNLRITGTEAAAMMLLLDQKGVCVSAGSACHSGSLQSSPVLAAMGLSPSEARQSLRISFSRFSTLTETNTAITHFISATTRVRSLLANSP